MSKTYEQYAAEIEGLSRELSILCANSPCDAAQTIGAMVLTLATCLESMKQSAEFASDSTLAQVFPLLTTALAMLDDYAKSHIRGKN